MVLDIGGGAAGSGVTCGVKGISLTPIIIVGEHIFLPITNKNARF